MSATATITVLVTIGLAFAGYVATYASNRLLAQRQARLERINNQLSNLYGPLLADQAFGKAAWEVYVETSRRIGPMWWDADREPNGEQSRLWQTWVEKVFQPTNRRMIECVKANAALLLEDKMPGCLIHVAENLAAYDVLAVRWGEPEFVATRKEDLVPPERFLFKGEELEDYVRKGFTTLKQAQQELLGELSRPPQFSWRTGTRERAR